MPSDQSAHDELDLREYLPVLEPLSEEDARTLERAFSADPDETDATPSNDEELRDALARSLRPSS